MGSILLSSSEEPAIKLANSQRGLAEGLPTESQDALFFMDMEEVPMSRIFPLLLLLGCIDDEVNGSGQDERAFYNLLEHPSHSCD